MQETLYTAFRNRARTNDHSSEMDLRADVDPSPSAEETHSGGEGNEY